MRKREWKGICTSEDAAKSQHAQSKHGGQRIHVCVQRIYTQFIMYHTWYSIYIVVTICQCSKHGDLNHGGLAPQNLPSDIITAFAFLTLATYSIVSKAVTGLQICTWSQATPWKPTSRQGTVSSLTSISMMRMTQIWWAITNLDLEAREDGTCLKVMFFVWNNHSRNRDSSELKL